MLSYWYKRKLLHKKSVPHTWDIFGTTNMKSFHCLQHQYGRGDVLWKRLIPNFHVSHKKPCLLPNFAQSLFFISPRYYSHQKRNVVPRILLGEGRTKCIMGDVIMANRRKIQTQGENTVQYYQAILLILVNRTIPYLHPKSFMWT